MRLDLVLAGLRHDAKGALISRQQEIVLDALQRSHDRETVTLIITRINLSDRLMDCIVDSLAVGAHRHRCYWP